MIERREVKEMKRITLFLLTGILSLAFGVQQAPAGGEFPIATTTGNEFGLIAAFDGTNYLVGIQGDRVAFYNITAQMISQTGSLVGSRISIGRTGGLPLVAFDGTNYLMVWEDDANYPDDDIYGQFIGTSGALVGLPFPISTAAGKQEFEFIGIAFGGTSYLVMWTDYRYSTGDQGPRYVYGQVVSKSGSLIGGEIRISVEPGHFPAIAFDGTNYLVVWVEDTHDTDYYGQFISPSGILVGQNFVIESNNLKSDNPSFILFDGTRYVVNVQDQISPDAWGHYVRFVDKEGNVSPTRITLYEGQTSMVGCYAYAFDGTNYLAMLSEGWQAPPVTAKARYYDANFNPIGDWFTIFETQDSKVLVVPFVIFDGTRYLTVTTIALYTGGEDWFSDGDVYGAFIEVIGDSDADGTEPTTPGLDISGEYWFGSLSADANSWVPWGKQGTVIINGNNWYQEWDEPNGHHSFSGTFTTSVRPDGSVNINHAWGSYNVAWNGNTMIHADTAPDAENRLGFDIIARKATNVDVNDLIGRYSFFGHWLGWYERYASVGWGSLEFLADGNAIATWVEEEGHEKSETVTWILDDVNGIIDVSIEPDAFLCEGGIISSFRSNPDIGGDLGYNFFVKESDEPITPDDIAGKYVVRFLETSVFGQPFTCGKGTATIRPDGTLSIDAYYSDGEHDTFDANYIVGPGNKFQITGNGDVDEGIVSPDLGIIFLPEYRVPPSPTRDDWIGGIFLVRSIVNASDLN